MRRNQKSGFTLLEIIVVLIILSVVIALALPRFFATVETARSGEAFDAFSAIRGAMERCYLMNSGNYGNCDLDSSSTAGDTTDDNNTLDVDDPADSPNAHFFYAVSNQSANTYTITATRSAVDGGDGSSTVVLKQNSDGTITRSGTLKFQGIH